MNLIKLIKYVNIETATKPYRLKSISSIEDSYIKVATRGVLKILQYSQENNCLGVSF